MKLALIAAVAKNRVIGSHGTIPWHISDDLKRFKRLTMGSPIVMGRKTYESIGRPLPGRRTIVITSGTIEGVECYPGLHEALSALKDQERVFVIGGGTLYAQALPQADELYLTHVDAEPPGDVLFPPFEDLLASRFMLVHREDHSGFHFCDYVAHA